MSPEQLQLRLDGHAEVALLDVREKVTSDAGHILGCSNVPRRLLEDRVGTLVPLRSTSIVVADHDGSMAMAAAEDLRAVGYEQVGVLEGGVLGWRAAGFPISQGHSVPSKDFGELVQEFEHVPTVSADELRRWMDEGRKIELCDVRTPEEHARETLPGSRNFPGFELPVRVSAFDEDATVVVHCSGRTRSILGAATLQRAGVKRVFALENGTMGWALAGYQLEHGAARDATRDLGRSDAPGAHWGTLAMASGVTVLPPRRVDALLRAAGRHVGTVYLFDVRSEGEYLSGHATGAVWAPSGQLVQLTDNYIAVRNAAVMVMCDDEARSAVTAYWLRRMGLGRVILVRGGWPAWRDAGLPVEAGKRELTLGLADARASVRTVEARAIAAELRSGTPPVVIHVGVSDGYEEGHLPGARWVSPTWLEDRLAEVAPDRSQRLVVTCRTGHRSLLTAWKARRVGWREVVVLEGGVAAWRAAGLPVYHGPPDDVDEPDDVFVHPIFRGPEAMRAYLEWEVQLGRKYTVAVDRSAEAAGSRNRAMGRGDE